MYHGVCLLLYHRGIHRRPDRPSPPGTVSRYRSNIKLPCCSIIVLSAFPLLIGLSLVLANSRCRAYNTSGDGTSNTQRKFLAEEGSDKICDGRRLGSTNPDGRRLREKSLRKKTQRLFLTEEASDWIPDKRRLRENSGRKKTRIEVLAKEGPEKIPDWKRFREKSWRKTTRTKIPTEEDSEKIPDGKILSLYHGLRDQIFEQRSSEEIVYLWSIRLFTLALP